MFKNLKQELKKHFTTRQKEKATFSKGKEEKKVVYKLYLSLKFYFIVLYARKNKNVQFLL